MSKMKTLEVLQQYLLHSGQSEELKEVSTKQIDSMIERVKKHVTENYVNRLFSIEKIEPTFDFIPKKGNTKKQKYYNVFNVKMVSKDNDLNGNSYNVIALVNSLQIISLRQNGKIQNIK